MTIITCSAYTNVNNTLKGVSVARDYALANIVRGQKPPYQLQIPVTINQDDVYYATRVTPFEIDVPSGYSYGFSGLWYPDARESGTIHVFVDSDAPRNVVLDFNQITNDSSLVTMRAFVGGEEIEAEGYIFNDWGYGSSFQIPSYNLLLNAGGWWSNIHVKGRGLQRDYRVQFPSGESYELDAILDEQPPPPPPPPPNLTPLIIIGGLGITSIVVYYLWGKKNK